MPNIAQPPTQSEDLLIGILAALALQGVDTLRIDDRMFHDAFGRALAVFRKAKGTLADLADDYQRDVVSKTYDALDDAMVAAEHYGMVKFPNPSYSRLDITITTRDAELLLNDWQANRKTFEKAAAVLKERALCRTIL